MNSRNPTLFNSLRIFIMLMVLMGLVIPGSNVLADDDPPPAVTEITVETEPPEPTEGDPSADSEVSQPSDTDETDDPTAEGDYDVSSSPDAGEEENPVPEVTTPLISQLPDGTDVVVVDEVGQVEPLVTQEAAEIVAESDPMWCPDGAAPVANVDGCTDSYTNMTDLLNALSDNQPAQDGTIWIEKTYNSAKAEPKGTTHITIDGDAYKTWRDYSLTVQGGWNGPGSESIDNDNPSIFSGDRLRIIDWRNDVTIKDISFNGGSGGASLEIEIDTPGTNTHNVVVENVEVKKNKNNRGARIDNDESTGSVSVKNSQFSNNGTNKNDDGLFIDAKGSVTLVDVIAQGNGDEGVEIVNFDSKTNASVQISGTNIFSGNKGYGLSVRSKGAITLENVTANSSKKDSGARLDNDENGASAGVTVSDSSFNGNKDSGFLIYSRGSVNLSDLNADNNKTQDGVYIDNDGGAGIVKVSGNTSFSGNGNGNGDDGLYIRSKGNVSLEDVVATGNKDEGVEINNTASKTSATVQLRGNSIFTGNKGNGLAILSRGNVSLSDITSGSNGADGVYVQNHTSATQASVSIDGNTNMSGNTSDGLYVRSKGTITLKNVTANSSKKDSGARLDNDEKGASAGISVTGSSFSGNNDYGLQIYSRGSVELSDLVANNNKTQDGVNIDNDGGTGSVMVSGSTIFNGNGNGKGDDGLYIRSKGVVTLVDIVANNNRDEGVEINNSASKVNAPVIVNGANLFQNTGNGLMVTSKGAIYLKDITSTNSLKDSGAILNNSSSVQDIYIGGENNFSGNNDYGLNVRSLGDITLENITADNNKTQDGAIMNNPKGGNVMIIGSNSFSGNGNGRGDHGLFVRAKGNITLNTVAAFQTPNRVQADGNKGAGAVLDNDIGNGYVLVGGMDNSFSDNGYEGLWISSGGDIDLYSITAEGNGKEGVELTTPTSSPNDAAAHCSVFKNNGTYGVFARKTRGQLSFQGENHFFGNGKKDYFYQNSKGVAIFDPAYECDLPNPPNIRLSPLGSGNVPELANLEQTPQLIPITDGEPMQINCNNNQSVAILNNRNHVIFSNLCGHESIIERIAPQDLPQYLSGNSVFLHGLSISLLKDGHVMETLPDNSNIILAFELLPGQMDDSFSLLYWDPTAKDGLGDWVAQLVTIVDGYATASLRIPGTFVMVMQ